MSTPRKTPSKVVMKGNGAVAQKREDLEQYFTMSDVAKRLNMSRQTLYTHVQNGRIKPKRFGRYSVLSESEIQKFMKKLRPVTVAGRERMVLAAI